MAVLAELVFKINFFFNLKWQRCIIKKYAAVGPPIVLFRQSFVQEKKASCPTGWKIHPRKKVEKGSYRSFAFVSA